VILEGALVGPRHDESYAHKRSSARERAEVTQLRITVWPGTPLPLPPTVRMLSELDPIGKVLIPRVEEHQGMPVLRREELKPSGQTYLRLLEVNLQEPEAMSTATGSLTAPGRTPAACTSSANTPRHSTT
jgi:hypothetical protein